MRFVLILVVASLLPLSNSVESESDSAIRVIRAKRQVDDPEANSVLTVEWEGIHAGVDDAQIKGFRVEYRPEHDRYWLQHDGVIPYKGADYQYRVRIKNLPGNQVYFVRISIIDHDDNVLIQTPPIKAHSEDGSVKVVCTPGQLSFPSNVRVGTRGYNTVGLSWESPECGKVRHFIVRTEGKIL